MVKAQGTHYPEMFRLSQKHLAIKFEEVCLIIIYYEKIYLSFALIPHVLPNEPDLEYWPESLRW